MKCKVKISLESEVTGNTFSVTSEEFDTVIEGIEQVLDVAITQKERMLEQDAKAILEMIRCII